MTKPNLSWVTGPSMQLTGGDEDFVIYHIPNGCKFLNYRYKVKEITGGASHTVQYVEKDSKIEINQAFNKNDSSEDGFKVALTLPVLEIGCPGEMEAKLSKLEVENRKKDHAMKNSNQAIIVHGITKKGGRVYGKPGKLDVVIEVHLEREPQEHPLGYMLVGGLVVAMLAWIVLYKKSGRWYEKQFGVCVRFVGKHMGGALGEFKYLFLEEVADHTFHGGKQVKGKPSPYQRFGVVIMLVVVAVGMIVYFVVPLAKENPSVKKWVDQAGRKLNKIFGGVDEKKKEKTSKKET
jgi:hypothetical protein